MCHPIRSRADEEMPTLQVNCPHHGGGVARSGRFGTEVPTLQILCFRRSSESQRWLYEFYFREKTFWGVTA